MSFGLETINDSNDTITKYLNGNLSTNSNAVQTDKRVGREIRPRKNERNIYTCSKRPTKIQTRIINPAKTFKQLIKIYISNFYSAPQSFTTEVTLTHDHQSD